MTIGAIAHTALRDSSLRLDGAARDVLRAAAPEDEVAAPGDDVTVAAAAEQVELSEAAVRLLQARRQMEVSLEVARTADQVARASIDLLA